MKQKVNHMVFENNDLAGLWTIDVDKIKKHNKDYWKCVDIIIEMYCDLHPDEMTYLKVANATERDETNTHGANKSGSMRQAISLPISLLYTLKDFDNRIFSDKKKLHTFMKRYPALRTRNEV